VLQQSYETRPGFYNNASTEPLQPSYLYRQPIPIAVPYREATNTDCRTVSGGCADRFQLQPSYFYRSVGRTCSRGLCRPISASTELFLPIAVPYPEALQTSVSFNRAISTNTFGRSIPRGAADRYQLQSSYFYLQRYNRTSSTDTDCRTVPGGILDRFNRATSTNTVIRSVAGDCSNRGHTKRDPSATLFRFACPTPQGLSITLDRKPYSVDCRLLLS
jgi:hypothetical protein